MKYFDPTRAVRASASPTQGVSSVSPQTPPPVSVPSSGYFDPTKALPVRAPYPTEREVAAFVATCDMATRLSLEGLKAHGETVEEFARRRLLWVPRCAECGALGGGQFGHRASCSTIDRRPHWLQRRKVTAVEPEPYDGDPDDDLPF